MELLGIRLVGLNEANGTKLLLTVALVVLLFALSALLRWLLRRLAPSDGLGAKTHFWARQAISLVIAACGAIGLASLWFDNPQTMTAALGLFTAGLGFALQKVITALAGYLLILRGNTFTVGDRIVMGGVRGNVIALGFFQTTIMEMGEPPSVQSATPAMWVKSRQFTGRIVTVTNDRVFDEPVYNYTRDFPFIWEEVTVPIAYRDDRGKAEAALLSAARRHAADPRQVAPDTLRRLQDRFDLKVEDFDPKVYWRLTDNWLEMTVRLVTPDRGVRDIKDAMARDILAELDGAGIGIASATSEIVGWPPLLVRRAAP